MGMGEQLSVTLDLKRLIGLGKAAEILDISLRELQRRIAAGEFPRPVKIGRLSKVLVEDVLSYIETLRSARER
jgi:predicted DNA-binding transcriptional regulator AlpA